MPRLGGKSILTQSKYNDLKDANEKLGELLERKDNQIAHLEQEVKQRCFSAVCAECDCLGKEQRPGCYEECKLRKIIMEA